MMRALSAELRELLTLPSTWIGLVQGLVASLALVLLIPPLLSGLGRVAGWLPDRAAAVLFSGPSESLPTWGGALVAAGWIAALLACGGVRFARTDP